MWILTKLETWLKSMVNESFKEFFDIIETMLVGVTDNLSVTPENTGTMFGDSSVVWGFITDVAEQAIFPVAGVLIAYTLAKGIIDELIDKNHTSQINTNNIIKVVVKLTIGLLLTVNALKIVSIIFGLGNTVIGITDGIITQETLEVADILDKLEDLVNTQEIPTLVNILISISLAKILAYVIKIGVLLVVYGRVLQMILYTTVAPIPFATFGNTDFELSQNYIKNIIALALQGFLILFIIGLYSMILKAQLSSLTIENANELAGKIYSVCGFGLLLLLTLSKTHTMTKSIMGSH